ncbi:MAG: hypothetical protein M0Z99_35170 [Betaproteobacteria bacterium]|nr:hypothetical protein [Betaproteobacteria bacterium]
MENKQLPADDNFSSMTREEKEQENKRLRDELDTLAEKLAERRVYFLEKAFHEQKRELMIAICEGVLKNAVDGKESLRDLFEPDLRRMRGFGLHGDDYEKRNEREYGELASLVKMSLSNAPTKTEGAITLRDYIKRNFASFNVQNCLYLGAITRDRVANFWDFCEGAFAQAEDMLSGLVTECTQNICRGLPLYERIPEGDGYALADEGADLYAYLRERGRRYDVVSSKHIPDWADHYYVQASDIDLFNTFFRSHWDMNEIEIERMRVAYRAAVSKERSSGATKGIAAKPSGATFDGLMRAIAEFPKKYPNYEISAPKLDADVRPWLKASGYAGNEREAATFGTIIAETFKLRQTE